MIDLLVAGGGPGGLATAIYAAQAGLEAVVVERRRGPIDKACGEGLMPHTVKHLEKLGVTLHGKAFRGITYLDSTHSVRADFRSGQGLGMRRTALSDALHGAAGPLRQRVKSRTAGRVMLVGDAAGYVDALTGEGLGIAFGGAELLVKCVAADDPGGYDRQWRQMSRRYRALTAGLLQASGCRPVRSMIVPAASALPKAFSGVVNLLAY